MDKSLGKATKRELLKREGVEDDEDKMKVPELDEMKDNMDFSGSQGRGRKRLKVAAQDTTDEAAAQDEAAAVDTEADHDEAAARDDIEAAADNSEAEHDEAAAHDEAGNDIEAVAEKTEAEHDDEAAAQEVADNEEAAAEDETDDDDIEAAAADNEADNNLFGPIMVDLMLFYGLDQVIASSDDEDDDGPGPAA